MLIENVTIKGKSASMIYDNTTKTILVQFSIYTRVLVTQVMVIQGRLNPGQLDLDERQNVFKYLQPS